MKRSDWHAHPQERTLGDVLDEAAAHPWRTLAEAATLLFILAVLAALYIMLWGMQP